MTLKMNLNGPKMTLNGPECTFDSLNDLKLCTQLNTPIVSFCSCYRLCVQSTSVDW